MARKSRHAAQQACFPVKNTVSVVLPDLEPIESVYKTAIYARLSVYNLGRDTSETIDNQIELLQSYVREHPDMTLIDLYIDNGRTGTTFQRPEFDRLIDDMKEGKINCIVVKDLSRFGRNYLETGYYMQKIFPFYNLRFVAITDGYDSLTADPDSMAVSMKNIVNDYYSKDISRKVSSSFDLKRSNGLYSWGHPPYGYRRIKEDPIHMVIDEETAPYVHLMFHWALEGIPIATITRNLTTMGAPTYQRLAHERSNGKTKRKGSLVWNQTTVRQILTNQVYAGDFVCNKSYCRKYDPANARWIPEDEWIIIPDTHPAYILREDFLLLKERLNQERADRSYKEKRENRVKVPNAFDGLVFCGTCHKKMYFRCVYSDKVFIQYQCKRPESQFHTPHRTVGINAKTLETVVNWQLNLQINYAIDIDDFMKRFSLDETVRQLKARRQANVNTLNGKLARLKSKRSRTFEDFSDGILDEETYRLHMDKLAAQMTAVCEEIRQAEKRRDDVDTYFNLDNKWLRTFVDTGGAAEMNSDLYHNLIQRIEVFSDNRITITFNYDDWMTPLLECLNEAKELDSANASVPQFP